MSAAVIGLSIFAYVIVFVATSMLFAYLDAKYWDYTMDDEALYIVCGIFWPVTLFGLFAYYVIGAPFRLFGKFLVWLTDVVDESKENKDK